MLLRIGASFSSFKSLVSFVLPKGVVCGERKGTPNRHKQISGYTRQHLRPGLSSLRITKPPHRQGWNMEISKGEEIAYYPVLEGMTIGCYVGYVRKGSSDKS